MTVQATIDSTLNGQTAEFILIEESPRGSRSHETKILSGGSENFVFTELDGGSDKTYYPKVRLETGDVTSTAQVPYGFEVDIDPLPHRDVGASGRVRENATFEQGVGARELGLGDHTLVGGLLTTALNDGEVLADDGYVYSLVQAAQDAASSWIFIGPGTFNEAVTVDTAGLSIFGSGHDSHIDGGTTNHAIDVTSNNVTINSIQASTTAGSGNAYSAINVSGSSATIKNIYISASDDRGVWLAGGSDHTVVDSYTENCDLFGVKTDPGVPRVIYSGCISTGNRNDQLRTDGQDCLISSCVAYNGGSGTNVRGITMGGADGVIIGCRVHNMPDAGIRNESADCIIANNRVSGSSPNLDIVGAGSITDGNNTGAAN